MYFVYVSLPQLAVWREKWGLRAGEIGFLVKVTIAYSNRFEFISRAQVVEVRENSRVVLTPTPIKYHSHASTPINKVVKN